MTRRKNGTQIQVTLRDSSPIEKLLGAIYESGEPQKIGCEYVCGTEYMRKLILLGYDRLQNGKERIPQKTKHPEIPTTTSNAHKPSVIAEYGTDPL